MYTLNVYHQDITTMENDNMETLDLISPEDSQQDKIDIEQYIRVYINIRSKKEDLVKQHEEQVAKLDEKMQEIMIGVKMPAQVLCSFLAEIKAPVECTEFNTAGAATAIVGSPIPPQKPPEGITITSTLGISFINMDG